MLIWTPGLLHVKRDANSLSCRVTNFQQCPCSREPPASHPPFAAQACEAAARSTLLGCRAQRETPCSCSPALPQPGEMPRGHLHLTWGPEHQQLSHPMQGLPGSSLIPTSASASSLCENGPDELGHGVPMTGAD